ncbi:MAG: FAD-dependent oxidoreductase [Acidimicrobiia bacterium]|nr:FAD-dependent oxidoreductase [Acidimicrobiia bacterium]
MPADPEEIHACKDEGIGIIELAAPHALHIEDGKLAGLICTKTEYQGDRDASGRKIPHDVPGSEFEIPLDTLILAISQHSVLDFFGDEPPALTTRGYIEVDPFTFESSIPGVYAGGDVAAGGPSSIVKAAADGKAVAAAIIAALGEAPSMLEDQPVHVDLHEMTVRRARREYRVPIEFSPLDQRGGFDETVLGYTAEQAIAEASRCLDCHEICSLCVGVCPNMALMTYEMEPFAAALPALTVDGAAVVAGEKHAYRAAQNLQIAVLTDFCNECGNCTTACPTSGDPYKDKPRLYLDRADFEAEKDNAFMVFTDGSVEGRWNGETHRLSVNGAVEYWSPSFSARLDLETFGLLEATAGAGTVEGQSLSLAPAADMFVLLQGLRGSMAHLPAMSGDTASGARIGNPGYEE